MRTSIRKLLPLGMLGSSGAKQLNWKNIGVRWIVRVLSPECRKINRLRKWLNGQILVRA